MDKKDISVLKQKLDEVFLYLDLGFRTYYIDCPSSDFVIEAENYLRTGMKRIFPANKYNDISGFQTDLGIFLVNEWGISNTGLNSFVFDVTDYSGDDLVLCKIISSHFRTIENKIKDQIPYAVNKHIILNCSSFSKIHKNDDGRIYYTIDCILYTSVTNYVRQIQEKLKVPFEYCKWNREE